MHNTLSLLRDQTTEISAKKAADHTLYHVSPKGFWKKFRDVVVVNPEISSGLPIPSLNRYPQPGSRQEAYASPATKASDPAENPYWKRDVRRAYPQLSVITQNQLTQILLASPDAQAAVAAPTTEKSEGQTDISATTAPSGLSQALSLLGTVRKTYSEASLPPKPAISYKKWVPERQQDAPHDPDHYWPMHLYK